MHTHTHAALCIDLLLWSRGLTNEFVVATPLVQQQIKLVWPYLGRLHFVCKYSCSYFDFFGTAIPTCSCNFHQWTTT